MDLNSVWFGDDCTSQVFDITSKRIHKTQKYTYNAKAALKQCLKSSKEDELLQESRAASSVSPRKSITTHTSASDDDRTGTKVVDEQTPELIELPKPREDTAKGMSRSDPKDGNRSEPPKRIAKLTSKQEEEASDIQGNVIKIQDHESSRSDRPPKNRYLPVPIQDKAADISFVTKTRDRHPRSSREEMPCKSRGGESFVSEYSTESTKISTETSISKYLSLPLSLSHGLVIQSTLNIGKRRLKATGAFARMMRSNYIEVQ